ncbi:hypothetical protein D8B26_007873 [Coccidioides posadasii str. Silveira]|uniref:Uncharacterized protein n=1 Tax=Coccidioides posadasii (strain RMSCC 757 / Silveira) TaxID=443226 RepID=E9D1K2_COCPS|nr:conserved hypothetical protein [Coccidioides posadasii str. Silveira]QVM13260.1 hypothetical protein D8B26_007873 [Coccidioides posadasii str. Silveira]
MAKSFRSVIESVLEEISLCGDRGASPAEVLGFVDAVYATQSLHNGTGRGTARPPKVDHQLKCCLWAWLTRHPEVSVGKNGEGNGFTLDQVLASNPSQTPLSGEIDPSLISENTAGPKEAAQDAFRVFVSQERMWLTITGHKPDNYRIFPLEFTLLSIIASHKSRGVVQGDLVRLSGQDKRSVPKRTDTLQQKGYIEKKAIQYKGARTSLCILRKYAASAPAEISQSIRPESERVGNPQFDEMIDFSALLDKLFGCLREHRVITRNDLKEKLGMTELWRSKVLRRAIRKLEAIGCVRRVQALSQYSEAMRSSHASIMLIREPTEKDIQLFHEDSSAVIASLQQDDDLDEAQAQTEAIEDMSGAGTLQPSDAKQSIVRDAGRRIPQWTPDQSLPNFIFSLVDKAGTRGMDNLEIAGESMGIFFRRPIEALLSRLVDSWQYSQPLHLRHLSLVRDTALRGTISYFVQYSVRNFAALVEDGQASWEAVETPVKKGATRPPPIDAKPELDAHGFVITKEPPNLVKQGNATLRECLESAKPNDYVVTHRDPAVVCLRDGTFGVRFGSRWRSQDATRAISRSVSAGLQSDIKDGIKRKTPDAGLGDLEEMSKIPVVSDMHKSKRRKKMNDLEQMSELDRLKAKGYDESWTAYSTLTLERPVPGLYLTPVGKRRAFGMRQGRPARSRVAIFKLPRLNEFSWFADETTAGVSENEPVSMRLTRSSGAKEIAAAAAPRSSSRLSERSSVDRSIDKLRDSMVDSLPEEQNGQLVASTEATPRDADSASAVTERSARKRKPSSLDDINPAQAQTMPEKPRRGRPPKKRRFTRDSKPRQIAQDVYASPDASASSGTQNITDINGELQQQQGSPPNVEPNYVLERSQNGKADTLAQSQDSSGEVVDENPLDLELAAQQSSTSVPTTATQRNKPKEHDVDLPVVPPGTLHAPTQEEQFEVIPMEIHTSVPRDEIGVPTGSGSQATKANGAHVDMSIEPLETKPLPVPSSVAPSEAKDETSKSSVKKDSRGGSIAFQRRKIVMDIIEQCGGAHPLGTELWYPFSTVWLKTRTEKPDMRTIRSAVKSLVDAGKLRQLTFSGKNSKGLMVTKSLIAKPDIDSMDPMIRDLQSAMLSADPQLYLHPKATIDPSLKKSHKGFAGHDLKLPEVENEVRVTLSYIPAKFRPRQPKPRTLRFIEDGRSFGRGDFGAGECYRRVRRLKSLQKMPSTSPFLDSLSIPAPYAPAIARPPVLRPWPLDEGYAGMVFGANWKPSLLLMLMSPAQTFNAATGTFGTGVCYMTRRRRSYRKKAVMPKLESLPNGLNDILSTSRKRSVDLSNVADPASTGFFSDIDTVRDWELRNEFPDGPPDEMLRYIDHAIPGPFESAPLEGPIRFEIDQPPPQQRKPMEPPVTRLATSRAIMEAFPARYKPLALGWMPQKGSVQPQRADAQSGRRLTQLQETTKAAQGAVKSVDRIFKRVRYAKDFPQRIAQKLTVAIVVVRTLAGGLEGKLIDWPLVTSVFPDYDSKFIQDRGKSIVSRHRLQMAKMQRDFQERYIEAYENDLVPSIDYNNLQEYDWESVVNWAEEQLERPSLQKVPSLPATHEQFVSIFDVRTEQMLDIDELYQHNAQTTIPRKRTLYANVPFSVPLGQKRPNTVSTLGDNNKAESIRRLEVAKTWVRANVITTEETYRPTEARQILERFGEELIGEAIQSLITERVISMSNRGKVTPGRNYDVTEHFLHAFGRKRAVEAVQLRRALHFKLTILDPAIQSEGKYKLEYGADDGDILVMINLATQGRVTIRPLNPPRNKYGLTERGYLTRMMDKTKLRFDVEIHPVPDRYIYGNPLAEKIDQTPVPNTDITVSEFGTSSTLPKVPLWVDVHGQFSKLLWELAVGAVVGLLAAIPGAGADTIGRIMQPYLGTWEVELVLQWLYVVGAVRHVREDGMEDDAKAKGGWTVKEWWYLALGS